MISFMGVLHAQPYTWTIIAGYPDARGRADGVGTNAQFGYPYGIARDQAGNLYVADSANYAVRKIAPVGTNWVVSTIWTNFGSLGIRGLAIDSAGSVYVGDRAAYTIWKLTPNGTNWLGNVLVGPDLGIAPTAIAIDADGNLYATDETHDVVDRISPQGTNWVVTKLVGLTGYFDSIDGTNSDARFSDPEGIAVDTNGNLFIGEAWSYTVREIMPEGTNWVATTIAGSRREFGFLDGTNSEARFSSTSGVAVASPDVIFAVDQNPSVRMLTRIDTNWVVTTVGGGGNGIFKFPWGITVDDHGVLYVTDNFNFTILRGEPYVPTLQYHYYYSDQLLALSWPLLSTGFVLEASSSLEIGATWSSITNGITAQGTNYVVTNDTSAVGSYFRLRK
jgi:hypothetical protein